MAGTAKGRGLGWGAQGMGRARPVLLVPTPSYVLYPLPFLCCAQPSAASTSGSTCSASTCSALQSDVAGLRTSVRALQSALNPDADGTINPARVCLRSLCLVGEEGADRQSIDWATAGDKHLYVRTKDRTQTLARFSTAYDLFTVRPNAISLQFRLSDGAA